MKSRMKEVRAFMVGVVVTLILTGTTLVVASPVVREIVFGVSVSIDGQLLEFEYDMRPFSMEGRTFLPVRAIADAMGLDVAFDPATNTALLTTPVSTATRFADTFTTGSTGQHRAQVTESVNILGTTHANVMEYSVIAQPTIYSDHYLSGNYSRITGVFGRVDGGGTARDATVTIQGDGVVLYTFDFSRYGTTQALYIDVSGVQLLRVTVNVTSGPGGVASDRTSWAISANMY